MRKFIVFVVFVALAVIYLPWLHPRADAAGTVNSVVFRIGVPEYVVNNQLPGVKMDVVPLVKNDRTFVPVRFLCNALGISNDDISWNEGTHQITIKGNDATTQLPIGLYKGGSNPTIGLTIGYNGIVIRKQVQITDAAGTVKTIGDSQDQGIDVAPMIYNNRTMLPARFVAEDLGYQVVWNQDTQTVVCWPAGQSEPDVTAAVKYLSGITAQPAPTTYILNGYQIPINTKLRIYANARGTNNFSPPDISFGIDFTKSDFQSQWSDATSILSQVLDGQSVNEIISYVEQKTNIHQKLDIKYWEINGKTICVASAQNAGIAQIIIWTGLPPFGIPASN